MSDCNETTSDRVKGERMTGETTKRHDWVVTGMDCASCANRISGAVERLPGVSDVQVAVMAERLSLKLDGGATSREKVEETVRKLGFGIGPKDAAAKKRPFVLPDADASAPTDDSAETASGEEPASAIREARWFETGKGRLVIVTGLLLAAAWSVKLSASETVAGWAFVAACAIGVAPVARRAFVALRSGVPFTIEGLMTVAAVGALFIGAAEEAALVVFLFAVGEVLEGVAAGRARAGIRALADVMPKTARLVDETGAARVVSAASLRVGQTVLVRPGDRLPADGEVIGGVSGIDESPVTGESVPRTRGPGESVFAGSINREAALKVRVTKAAEDNTISRIIRLVEEAEMARAPTERFIDRFSRVYMPAVVGLALLVAIVPPLVMGAAWETWTYRALALLLIGCPCALVISVPASIASALSTGAKRGLLMKGGAVIEAVAAAQHVAFDKTGTLTLGQPAVTDVVPLSGTEAEVLSVAASVEAGSSHPLAEAVLRRAEKDSIAFAASEDAKALPGRGVTARVSGQLAWVGSPRYAVERGVIDESARLSAAALEGDGKTVVVVFREDAALGLIAFRDEPREDATPAIRQLQALGLESVMLTGDNVRTGSAIAGALGTDYRAELMPEDKVAEVQRLAASGGVVMVGDGINDAPALATASVGVAMGSGTDVALETADAAILRNRVTDVAAMVRLARAAMSNIRQNVAIALGLKAIFLVTTVLGITGLWIAILADTGATVLVTLNALRLLSFRPETARSATG